MLPFRLTAGVSKDSKPAMTQFFLYPYFLLAFLPVARNFVQPRKGNVIAREKNPGMSAGL